MPPYGFTWWGYVEPPADESDGDVVVAEVVIAADKSLKPGDPVALDVSDRGIVDETVASGGRFLIGATADNVSFRVSVDDVGGVTILNVPGCGELSAERFHDYAKSAVASSAYPDEIAVFLDIAGSVPGSGGWVPYQEALGFDPSEYPDPDPAVRAAEAVEEWVNTDSASRSAIPSIDPIPDELKDNILQADFELRVPSDWRKGLKDYLLCTKYSLGFGPCTPLVADFSGPQEAGAVVTQQVNYLPGDLIEVWLVSVTGGYRASDNTVIGQLMGDDVERLTTGGDELGLLVVSSAVSEASRPEDVSAAAASEPVVSITAR